VFDSGPPGALAEFGIHFDALRALNPHIVHVQITAFGSDGPYAEYPASDLTIAALGGPLSIQGDADMPPVRMSVPQSWRHAGAEAAVAAMVALERVRTTGEAVFVDVSAQAAMTWTMLNATLAHAIQGENYERSGADLQLGTVPFPLVHACKDGFVIVLTNAANFAGLRDWMLEDGIIDDAWLAREDWSTYDYRLFRNDELLLSFEELTATYRRFIAQYTKAELFQRGLDRGVTLAPVNTLDDLLAFEQLATRDYFVDVEFPAAEVGEARSARAPGAFAKFSNAALEIGRPAPRLGEHTEEVLREIAEAPRERTPLRDTPSDGSTALPFEGLKVADFSWVGVGPISAKYLADHGATVVRIESQSRGDALRTAGPFKDAKAGWNRSHFFGEFNNSKRSLALDLKHPKSLAVAERALEWADVVLESFTPGALDRLGLGYARARELNPSVIMASTCLMGQTGPFAQLAGYGYHAAGVAGFYEITGWPDRPPAGPWQAYTDTIAPRFLATTLLAALDERRRTGAGTHIDLGQLEAALHFLAPELLARQLDGTEFTRVGNRDREAAPHGVYPCAGEDQWCAIAVEDDAQWSALRRVLGEPDWARDTKLDSAAARLAESDRIDTELSKWTATRPAQSVMSELCAAGIPAGKIQRSSDLLVDPQYAHREFHRWFEHSEMGNVPYSGHQFRITGYANGPRSASPTLGEHSFEVLGDFLGFSDEEIAELMGSGALA
jgi:crotonobetainyl-CoA:carnitine CoA-transferase CaiB-like acyl-CoA transferase